MKIIFDSKEQKGIFLKLISEPDTVGFCPDNFNLEETRERCSMPECCRKCWEDAAELIVMEN